MLSYASHCWDSTMPGQREGLPIFVLEHVSQVWGLLV